MILVDVDGVGMSRPTRPLFHDVSVTVAAGDRLGVVGINGTGKSTLLGVISGSVTPESGRVRRGREVSSAALDQMTELPHGSVRDAVGSGWRGEAVLDRLGLSGLLDASTDQLSGGQEKRVALATALVADADLLVLDEPTNHLDVDAIEWLEAELTRFRGGLVIVTHDRHLLDRVTNRVLELDRGAAHLYDGGYAAYLEGRAVREERAAAAETTRRNLARRELAWLRRGAPARTRKSKARVEKATGLVTGGPTPPARSGDLDLGAVYDGTPRLGDQVVELHDAAIGFPGHRPLAEGVELLLDRRERLGLVGANGSGKTTMLEVLAGRRPPLDGEVVIGPTARIAFHDQHGRDLDRTATARELVAGDGARPDWWDAALLERFWFDADVQRAPVGTLSGGERRRLQLVLTLVAKPNVLLLDEPTNDLDLDTLRALEDFLDDWPGAVVAVSHDRTFLERTVDDVVVIDDGRAGRWPGGYGGWLYDRHAGGERRRPIRSRPGVPRRETSGRSTSTIRHELKDAEASMARLQRRAEELAATLSGVGADHTELARLGQELATCEHDLAEAEDRWLQLTDELESR